MRIKRSVALVALPAALLTAGCGDYLSAPDIERDPNRASTASSVQLLGGVHANAVTLFTGHLSRVLSIWTQQMAGTDRQYLGYGLYSVLEGTFSGEFDSFYTGGGLLDLRRIQAEATTANDRTLRGIAKVWEAYFMGTAADVWGAIPYSEAANPAIATPKLDTQAEVYAAMQTLLDGAIADLSANQGAGPGVADLIYAGDRTKWIQAARTLKARFYLHTAETNNGAYALALAQATQGISTPADDFRTFHTSASGGQNFWFQFFRERDSYARAGAHLVNLLTTRSDPRRTAYFGPNQSGTIVGAAPGQQVNATHSWLSATRGDAAFRQPLITWEENQLIIAEARYRGGDQAGALTALNAVRTAAGLPASAAAGTALLVAILEEKYIALFQNIEAYNDYKRTCYPNITPASNAYNGNVPARLFYSSNERSANPNIPSPSTQPRRNANDPVTPTAPDGAACLGQRP